MGTSAGLAPLALDRHLALAFGDPDSAQRSEAISDDPQPAVEAQADDQDVLAVAGVPDGPHVGPPFLRDARGQTLRGSGKTRNLV